uniref:G protein subunit beta 1 like n=1 Tax=Capra hircus TaxID=9925 RepID=A0A8C2S2Z5_CAPHI
MAGDDRGLYPQGLEEVLQAPDGPAECCAAMLWALSPASSRPLVAPQLPVPPSEHRLCRCGGAPSEAAYVPPSQWGGPAGRLVWFQVAPERWARCWAEAARLPGGPLPSLVSSAPLPSPAVPPTAPLPQPACPCCDGRIPGRQRAPWRGLRQSALCPRHTGRAVTRARDPWPIVSLVTGVTGKRMAAPAPDPQFTLRGAGSAVCALHFCSGAQGRPLLLSGSLRGLVHIWNLETRRPLAALDGHGGQCVTWLHTLPRGPQLLSQGRDLQLCVWDLAEGRSAVVDAMHLESVGFCRASVLAEGPQRWMLAVPGRGNDEVQILELPSKTLVSCLKPEAGARLGMPMCLQLWQAESSPRPLLLAGYEDGSLALWDVSMRKLCSRAACHSEPVMGLALDPRRARGVSGSAEKALAVWSLEGQQALQVRGTHELTNPGIADLKIRPDSKILATAGWDHRVRVFQWRTMRPLAVLAFHSATVHCVAFDATGLLAAGSGDQRISVWSLYPPT